ncbi:hypothetical protein KAT08_01895 [Candidatus Babeliales bacterium]|nr:hypothetical protein [Candidatus Babeliales bacterium]
MIKKIITCLVFFTYVFSHNNSIYSKSIKKNLNFRNLKPICVTINKKNPNFIAVAYDTTNNCWHNGEKIVIWNVDKKEPLIVLSDKKNNNSLVTKIFLNEKNSHILAAKYHDKENLAIWDTRSKKQILNDQQISCISYHPQFSDLFAISTKENTIFICQLRNKITFIKKIQSSKSIIDLSWHPTKRDLIAAVFEKGKIKIFDFNSIKKAITLKFKTTLSSNKLMWGKKGNEIIIIHDKFIEIIDPKLNKNSNYYEEQGWYVEEDLEINDLRNIIIKKQENDLFELNPLNANIFAISNNKGNIKIMQKYQHLITLNTFNSNVIKNLSWNNAYKNILASSSYDSDVIKIWNVESKEILKILKSPSNNIRSLFWNINISNHLTVINFLGNNVIVTKWKIDLDPDQTKTRKFMTETIYDD